MTADQDERLKRLADKYYKLNSATSSLTAFKDGYRARDEDVAALIDALVDIRDGGPGWAIEKAASALARFRGGATNG